jgi:DNA relaxase NicK
MIATDNLVAKCRQQQNHHDLFHGAATSGSLTLCPESHWFRNSLDFKRKKISVAVDFVDVSIIAHQFIQTKIVYHRHIEQLNNKFS